MNEKIINFKDFLDSDSRVLSGREIGESCAHKADFNNLLDKHNIEINLPQELRTIHPSFGLGFFGVAIRKIGSYTEFLQKVKFTFNTTDQDSIESLKEDIDYIIERSLRGIL